MSNVYWTEAVLAALEEQNPWYRRAWRNDASRVADPAGVNLCGYLRDESGWGAAGRGYMRGLRAAELPFTLLDVSAFSSNRSGDTTLFGHGQDYPIDTVDCAMDHLHPINLVCVDAGQHYTFMNHVGEAFLDRYTIGAWAWELPRFPQKWYDRLAYYDEIWVGTSFIANALAPVSPVPVVRVPPVLTPPQEGSRTAGRWRLGLSADTFLALFIFDVHSHVARKNPGAVVQAFKRAFSPDEKAQLVIKSVNAASDPAAFRALEDEIGGHRITLLDGYWPASEVHDLMAACDVYVSLHRSEGTGLTITDAMALGKPVIATGWSGNMDVMTVANSFPVSYELVPLTENVGPYDAGETWAEPSLDHAAGLLRQVYEDQEGARRRGEMARQDMAAQYSPRAIGSLMRERLQVITHRDDIPHFRHEMGRYFAGYQSLTRELRMVVEAVVPPGATVGVVSKGDDALLAFRGRTGWHFPRTEDGTYAGYHPADDEAAISHLQELQRDGATFLLFPVTSFWWLEHYPGLRAYLEGAHRRVWHDQRCAIYQLLRPNDMGRHEIRERAGTR